jgi:uncharacterized protein (TIGR03067 family)
LDTGSASFDLLLVERIRWLARYALVVCRWDPARDGATQLAVARRTVARRLWAFPVLGEVGLQVVFCGPREQWQPHIAAMPADLTGWHTVIIQGVHLVDPERGERALNQSSWGQFKFGGTEGVAGQIDLLLRELVGRADLVPPAERQPVTEASAGATDGVGKPIRKPSSIPWLILGVALAVGIVTAVLLVATAQRSHSAEEDQQALRGVWSLQNPSELSPVTLEFDYPRATLSTSKEVTRFTFRIDPSQTPAQMDLIPEGNSLGPKLLIYELNGDTLRIGFTVSTQGTGERPKEFEPLTVWIFKRKP